MRRLLGLDYVLEHPRLPWLPTEADRVAAFEALGIERGLLPQRVYRGALGGLRRFFPLGMPVALDSGRAVFVYAEPGYETATAIRSWDAKHGDLWKGLWDLGLKIEVVAVVRRWKEYGRAEQGAGQLVAVSAPVRNRRGDPARPCPYRAGHPRGGCPRPRRVRRLAAGLEARHRP